MDKIDKMLLVSIKKHEGLRLEAYQDSKGIWTCGYGRNLEEVGVPTEYASLVCISEEKASEWLEEDIAIAISEAKQFPQYNRLNRARRNVFIEMVFQMGRPRVSKFVNMLESISLEPAIVITNWQTVSEHMLDSKWAREDSPSRAAELAHTMRVGWYG